MIRIAGIDLELFDEGQGAPLLLLHGGNGFDPKHPYVDLLAARHRVIAPSHPGFGKSSLPDWLDHIDDIAHLYLELLDQLALPKVDLLGFSVGGWIAAELATKIPERIGKFVAVGPVGVKVGPVDRLDIPDMFGLHPEEVQKLLWHDPEKMRFIPADHSDEELAIVVRNRETLALLVWEPYMHNPKLKHRLHRLTMPALFMRGASDGLVSADYLEAYAKLLPNARVLTVPKAGHLPQVEQPDAFVASVLEFLGGSVR